MKTTLHGGVHVIAEEWLLNEMPHPRGSKVTIRVKEAKWWE